MKLELKHLACYLPYGIDVLKSMEWIDGSKREWVVRLDFDNILSLFGCSKPILRPLSDLTKEIEHNGERFIPIKEIWKLLHPDSDLINCECDGEEQYATKDYGQHIFSYDPIEKCFGLFADWHNDGDKPHCVFGGYDLMQKLFEWHYDVFGLTEEGLAISYNDIK